MERLLTNQAKEQNKKMDLMRSGMEMNAETNRTEMEKLGAETGKMRADTEKIRDELEKQREENKEIMRMLKHLVATNTGEK